MNIVVPQLNSTHNPEVAGSNPVPATKTNGPRRDSEGRSIRHEVGVALQLDCGQVLPCWIPGVLVGWSRLWISHDDLTKRAIP